MMNAFLPLLHTFAANSCQRTFFGLKPWYAYLNPDPSKGCAINLTLLGSHSSLLLIGLAILDDLIRVAALVAVAFVIYGGIQYVTSQGSPEDTTKARQTIINALVGLLLAIIAASLVSFVGGKLGNLS